MARRPSKQSERHEESDVVENVEERRWPSGCQLEGMPGDAPDHCSEIIVRAETKREKRRVEHERGVRPQKTV